MQVPQLMSVVLFSSVLSFACDSEKPQRVHDSVVPGDDLPQASLKAEQVSGTYLFGISTIVAPPAPVVYLVELAAEARDDQLEVRLRKRAISKLDRVTAVGEWSDWTTGWVDAEGAWNSDTIHALIPVDANPIVAVDTEAEIVLAGQLLDLRDQDDPTRPLDFLCGDVTGRIIDPIPVDDLTGSTFAATRIEDVDDVASYPEIIVDCDRRLPRPLP